MTRPTPAPRRTTSWRGLLSLRARSFPLEVRDSPRNQRNLRALAAVPVAGALLAGALAATTAAPASAAVPTLTTFTLNINYNLSTPSAMADASRALTTGAVGGFQELSGAEDREALARLLEQRKWGYYMPKGAGVAIPIVWNTNRFSYLGGRSVRVHGPEEGVTPSRYLNSVLLRDRMTGRRVGVINTHTISQASRDAQATDARRVPRLRQHISMLGSEIRRMFTQTENVVAMGDLNVNYLADRRRRVAGFPTATLGGLVTFNMPATGSRGPGSLLDYQMTLTEGSGLTATASRIVGGFNSDHDAVVVRHRMTDLFAPGTLRNNPRGDAISQRVALLRMQRAVLAAEPGGIIRVASGAISSPGMVSALSTARAKDVRVAVKRVPGMRGSTVVVYGIGGAPYRVLSSNRVLVSASVHNRTVVTIESGARAYRRAATAFDRR